MYLVSVGVPRKCRYTSWVYYSSKVYVYLVAVEAVGVYLYKYFTVIGRPGPRSVFTRKMLDLDAGLAI
jgi:hypothetical protein